MKFHTIIKSVLIVFLWMILGVACGPDCGDNGEYKIVSYTLIEKEGYLDARTGLVAFDNFSPELQSSDTVRYNYAGFELDPETELVAINEPGIFSNTFADDCAPPDPSQKYVSIAITSNNAYATSSKTFYPGESLNEIFAVYGGAGGTLEAELVNYYAFEHGILFYLKTPPANFQPHQFKFSITFDDGHVFTSQAETLMITP